MSEKEDDKNQSWEKQWDMYRPTVPIVATILTVIAWLVFILLYALYWSNGFSIFQNVIVTVVSLVIAGLVIGLEWVVWGMRHARRWMRWGDWDRPK
jgi:high-affinity Fe2+/Pb2+ permease